jgi:hypothetical protein
MQPADQCLLWKFTNSAENLVLQALQFQNVDICSEFPGGESISNFFLYGCTALCTSAAFPVS